MEGQIPIPTVLLWTFLLVIVASLIVIFYVQYVSFGQVACWTETLKQVDPITKEYMKQELDQFQVGVSVTHSCADRLLFGNAKECAQLCSGTGEFAGEREECLEECSLCLETKTCIIAVPDSGAWTEVFTEGPTEYFKKSNTNIKVFTSRDFSLFHQGEDVAKEPIAFIAPEEGVDYYCLRFSLQNEGHYSFSFDQIESLEGCEPTDLL